MRDSIDGTVWLTLTLSGCNNIGVPNTRTMVLALDNSDLDVAESDYDGDGRKNKDERGPDDPEWDPGR